MKFRIKQIVLVAVMLAAVGLVQACAGPDSPQVSSQTTTNTGAIEVSSLTIDPPEAGAGVPVVIAAKVTNAGNAGNTYTPTIRIEDIAGGSPPVFQSLEDVDIPAGEAQFLTFVIPTDTLGTYQVTWGELTGEFVVVTPSSATAEETPPAPTAFETVDLAINPAEVYPDVAVIITAQVRNTGDTEGTYTAGLRLGDEIVAAEEVTLAAGASQPVSFVGSITAPGTYKVIWAELVGESLVPRLTGELVVVGDETPGSSNSGTAAPDFTAADVVTGETVSLSQFAGSTVLLNFVNYGCNPSTNKVVGDQLLAIRELTEQRDDFMPISVFCGCCPVDVLRDYARQNNLTWPWILDTDYSIVQEYASHLRKYGYPTLVFIDEEQQIREVSGYCHVSTLAAKIDQTSQ